MKEEIRQYKRNSARIGGTPQKNQTEGEREHNSRNKDQLTERLIKLRELGCGKHSKPWSETRSGQLPWYCSDTKRGSQYHNSRITEEYLNTHNEGEEALEQMDKLGIAHELWEGEGHVKPEEWWDRFGDEPDHYNQILRLIHRLAKIRKLVRERTRDNQNLVNIYQQILQQADNTLCEDRSWPSLLPIKEEWDAKNI